MARTTTIEKVWINLLKKLKICGNDSLLIQSVTQEMFQARLKTCFTRKQAVYGAIDKLSADITEVEKNVIMYICGYIPVSLINRYEKRMGAKYASYVQCLLNMAVGKNEDTFYEYARQWLENVNRGGAFQVSDEVYNFFWVVESNTRSKLKLLLETHRDDDQDKKSIVENLITSEDISFHWSILTIDLEEQESTELLNDILTLWLTIRGFSISGAWIEQHKKISGETSKSKPGLCKGFKRTQTVYNYTFL